MKENSAHISKYSIREQVQVRLNNSTVIKVANIEEITFTISKIYYVLSCEYDKDVVFRMDNIDSSFVEDLNQERPKNFAKLEDIKKILNIKFTSYADIKKDMEKYMKLSEDYNKDAEVNFPEKPLEKIDQIESLNKIFYDKGDND